MPPNPPNVGLTPEQVLPMFTTGNSGADITGLYALRNVTVGDTIDMSTVDGPRWQVIQRAVVIGVSNFVEIAANFSGLIVTMPAGLNGDSGYLLLWGC